MSAPTALNAVRGSWGAARIDSGSAWVPSPLAPPATWQSGEVLGAGQREGPRGMTWHPEAPRPLLRFARCGGRARLQGHVAGWEVDDDVASG
uniref:Uncharacterized protein n=1 Tax=Oryza sativa subsp. japonica TaxID=39947 RepID=Q6ZG04_ORYSJ|nr:hypothetical protein [Oryza sativa Japonica Group]